jgi:hypothetical protein
VRKKYNTIGMERRNTQMKPGRKGKEVRKKKNKRRKQGKAEAYK